MVGFMCQHAKLLAQGLQCWLRLHSHEEGFHLASLASYSSPNGTVRGGTGLRRAMLEETVVWPEV